MRAGDIVSVFIEDGGPTKQDYAELFDQGGSRLHFTVERVAVRKHTVVTLKELGKEFPADIFEIITYANPGDKLEDMFKDKGRYNNSMLAYQLATGVWVEAAFEDRKNADGEDVVTSLNERNYRGFEENCELYQSGGMTREQMHKIVDMVQDKPVEPMIEKEVGGVLSTLAAFCNARSIDMWKCAIAGLKRNWDQIDAIRDRQKKKPAMVNLDAQEVTSTGNIVRPTPNLRWNLDSGELEQYFVEVTPGLDIMSSTGFWKPVPHGK